MFHSNYESWDVKNLTGVTNYYIRRNSGVRKLNITDNLHLQSLHTGPRDSRLGFRIDTFDKSLQV